MTNPSQQPGSRPRQCAAVAKSNPCDGFTLLTDDQRRNWALARNGAITDEERRETVVLPNAFGPTASDIASLMVTNGATDRPNPVLPAHFKAPPLQIPIIDLDPTNMVVMGPHCQLPAPLVYAPSTVGTDDERAALKREAETSRFLAKLPAQLAGFIRRWLKRAPTLDKSSSIRRMINFLARRHVQHTEILEEARSYMDDSTVMCDVELQYWGFALVLKRDGSYHIRDTSSLPLGRKD